MANQAYDNQRFYASEGGIDWLTNTIKATLVKPTYIVNSTHDGIADLGANQLAGVTPQTLNVTGISAFGEVNADSLVFTGVTTGQTAKAIVLYVDLGGGVTKLLWYLDIGTGFPLTTTGAAITVDWNASVGNGIVWKAV